MKKCKNCNLAEMNDEAPDYCPDCQEGIISLEEGLYCTPLSYAKKIGISKAAVIKRIQRATLPAYKMGNNFYLIKLEEDKEPHIHRWRSVTKNEGFETRQCTDITCGEIEGRNRGDKKWTHAT